MLRTSVKKEKLLERFSYSLKELCRATEVTERTVRYYISEGLLPPSSGSGPFSRYGYEHWLRLQIIRRLKDNYLPLSEIKNLLAGKTVEQLDRLAQHSQLINGTGARQAQEVNQTLEEAKLEALLKPPHQTDKAALQQNTNFYALNESGQEYAIPDENEAASSSLAQELYQPPPPPGASFKPTAFTNRLPEEQGLKGPNYPAPGVRAKFPSPPAAGFGPMKMQASSSIPPDAIPPTQNLRAMSRINPEAAQFQPPVPPPPMPASAPAPMQFQPLAQPVTSPDEPPTVAAVPQPEVDREQLAIDEAQPQTWERIVIAPGVELHVESKIANQHRPAISQLLQEIRRLLGK